MSKLSRKEARKKRLAQEEKRKQNKPTTPPALPVATLPVVPAAPQQAATSSAAPSATTSAVAEKKSFPWAIMISIVAAVISGAALWVSYSQKEINQRQAEINQGQYEINQRSQDRASGKIRARFAFMESKNTDSARTKPFIKKHVGTGKEIFRIDTVDDLLRWAPFVAIQNIGDEIIDNVKIEIDLFKGHAYGFGVKQIEPWPLIYSDTSTCEIPSFGKLHPNGKAAFFVAPLLMEQMLHSRLLGPFPDAERDDIFRIRVYCRLVGIQSYDEIQPNKSILLGFHWRQMGFDEKKCEYFINQLPKVIID